MFEGNYGGASSRIVPAFNAIYGGYYIGMGAIFDVGDLIPNPDAFAAKITEQFVLGAQLGWMSLGGRDNQNPSMAMFDLLMDEKYDAEIDF